MERKISSDEERRMTGAIEKAATLASSDETRDRSALLAECLLRGNVDSRFAKVASAAFNKRLTVLTFQKTADEHKGEPFQLSDSGRVFALMGGMEPVQEKTASVKEAPFSIRMTGGAPQMRKTASAGPARVNYEDRVSADVLERHVDSMLQKQAAAFGRLHGMLCSLDAELERGREELKTRLEKCAAFDFHVLCNAFGDGLAGLMKDSMPGRDFTKTASGAVPPDTHAARLASALIKKAEVRDTLNDALCDYRDALYELMNSARELGEDMHKTAGIGDLIRAGAALAGASGQASQNMRDALIGSTSAGFGNAAALMRTGDRGTAPAKALDSEFLIRDRFRDRLLGWSDMSADPLLSMYPAEQVFMATQKAMDLDTTLERPDRREVLRALVSQLLAQNNRMSNADVAALATTLRGLGSAGDSATEKAYRAVSDMAKEAPPEAPELANMLTYKSPYPVKDYFGDLAAANKAEAEANAKRESSMAEAAAKKVEADAKARRDAVSAVFKDMNLKSTPNPDVFVDNHNNQMSRAQVVDLVNARLALSGI